MPTEIITDETELTRAGFHWQSAGGVTALICTALEREGFTNAFSTRVGGVSPFPQDSLNLAGFNDDAAENIYENRRRFLKLLGGEWTLAACWQTHSADVRLVKDTTDARPPEASLGENVYCDALVTDTPGILLGVKTADCVPVLLADARTGACAAIHAGWRGTVSSIVLRAIERMAAQFGTQAANISAAIGPAARQCCYEVGGEVIEAFHKNFADADALFQETREGHALVDLHRANREQLIGAGVPANKIYTAPLCTMCRTDLFFSYRKEKRTAGRVGRLMSVIGKQG